jgi:hypothetical protein
LISNGQAELALQVMPPRFYADFIFRSIAVLTIPHSIRRLRDHL